MDHIPKKLFFEFTEYKGDPRCLGDMARKDQYQAITDRIIAALDEGTVPWQKPWHTQGLNLPANGTSGKAYRGINVVLTMLTAWERGYSSNVWVTFKQANEIASRVARKAGHAVEQNKRGTWVFADGENKGQSVGGIRAGQNAKAGQGATPIIFWKTGSRTETDADTGSEVEKTWAMMRSYNVFALEQCEEGVQAYLKNKHGISSEEAEHEPHEAAEALCEQYEIETRHGGDRAYYSPKGDYIQMPLMGAFTSPDAYYVTRFHEMGHSTGAVGRLHRKGVAEFDYFGSHQYAEEELVAEFTACFLAAEAGIEHNVETSAGYIKVWKSRLNADPRLIVRVAQAAQKAADLITGRTAKVEAKEDAA
jgi:antirestriction protein ArdC